MIGKLIQELSDGTRDALMELVNAHLFAREQ